MVQLQHLEMIKPGGNGYNEFLQKQKNIISSKYPRKNSHKKNSPSPKNSSIDLNIEYGFEGNLYNNKVPNDNTLAISDEGLMIAGINSSYIVYDKSNDTISKKTTLNSMTFHLPIYFSLKSMIPNLYMTQMKIDLSWCF